MPQLHLYFMSRLDRHQYFYFAYLKYFIVVENPGGLSAVEITVLFEYLLPKIM